MFELVLKNVPLYYVMFSVTDINHVTGREIEGYDSLMFSLKDTKDIVFGLSACRDAQMAFSKVPGIREFSTYELVIGAQGNTKTLLRKSMDGTIVAQVDTSEILDCSLVRMFWVTWRVAGELSFGIGPVVGQGRLLYFKDPSPHEINALSVSTPPVVRGVWKFYHLAGELIVFTIMMFCAKTVNYQCSM